MMRWPRFVTAGDHPDTLVGNIVVLSTVEGAIYPSVIAG
jgi:hypothetical protein